MKPTTILTLCFLLFSFTTHVPLAISYVEQVEDVNGDPIFPGSAYYIIPALRGPGGGGVWPGETGNQTCPVTVLQDYSEVERGEPVKFSVSGITPGPGTIFTTTHVDIAFEKNPECVESSTKWVVVSDDFPEEWVAVGGDGAGASVSTGSFKIRKIYEGYGYKLVFCPTITAPPGACFDIGRHNDEKGRRLILLPEESDHAFRVVFGIAGDENGIRSIV